MNERFLIPVLFFISMISCLSLIVAVRNDTPHFAVIDTQVLIAHHAKQIAQKQAGKNISPDHLQKLAEDLRGKVEEWADAHGITLIAKGTIWGGSLPDYTESVLLYLEKGDLGWHF